MSTTPWEEETHLWRSIFFRLSELAVLGGLSYVSITASLLPAVSFIAGAGGGMYASRLYALIRNSKTIRAWVDANYNGIYGPGFVNIIAGTVAWAFYSQATAAAVVAFLGLIFSGLAVGVLAYFGGGSSNDAWAAFVAFISSQAVYVLSHPAPEPVTAPPPRMVPPAVADAATGLEQ